MIWSPHQDALDLSARIRFNRLYNTPLQLGTWALLEPGGLQNHAPQLCWLSSQQLACVWMAGGQEGTEGMSIVMATLRKGSGRWSKPKRISQDPQRSEQNPLLFLTDCEHPQRLQLIHTAQQARQPKELFEPDSAFSMQWTAQLRWQHRNPEKGRWSRSQPLLSSPAFCRNPPLQRQDRRWLLPIYRSLETGGVFGHDHSEVLLLNSDGSPTDTVIPVPNSKGRVHGSIATSADGCALLQFFRSRQADRIYRSIGSLDGLNWSTPQPTSLPNNNSSIQAIRLRSGRLAMIFNRFALQDPDEARHHWGEALWPRTRWPLSLAISDDDGDSWPWIRDLDHGLGFAGDQNWNFNGQLAYPSLVEGQPGELHLAYSWGGRQAIRYMCIDEEQVIGECF